MLVVKRGLRTVHHTPSEDLLYLTVRSRVTSRRKSPLNSQRLRNSVTKGVLGWAES
jgi:hypothetical protein